MQRSIAIIFFWSVLAQSYGQAQNKISGYLLTSYCKTLSDKTLGNNPWSIGLGVQVLMDNRTRLKPILEITGDLYLEDDKVQRLTSDGKPIPTIKDGINLFPGCAFDLTQRVFLSVSVGPSLINGATLLGIKPAFGFFLSKNKRWISKVSYVHVYNREHEDFRTLSISLGCIIF